MGKIEDLDHAEGPHKTRSCSPKLPCILTLQTTLDPSKTGNKTSHDHRNHIKHCKATTGARTRAVIFCGIAFCHDLGWNADTLFDEANDVDCPTTSKNSHVHEDTTRTRPRESTHHLDHAVRNISIVYTMGINKLLRATINDSPTTSCSSSKSRIYSDSVSTQSRYPPPLPRRTTTLPVLRRPTRGVFRRSLQFRLLLVSSANLLCSHGSKALHRSRRRLLRRSVDPGTIPRVRPLHPHQRLVCFHPICAHAKQGCRVLTQYPRRQRIDHYQPGDRVHFEQNFQTRATLHLGHFTLTFIQD